MRKITIRRATDKDAAFLARIMFRAAQSHLAVCPWTIIFSETESRTLSILEKICLNPALPWSYTDKFLIAELDARPSAAMCGFDPAHAKPLLPEQSEVGVAQQLFNYTAEQCEEIAARLAITNQGMPDDLADAWAIESIAVLPELEGYGLVDRLFQEQMKQAKQHGFSQVQVFCLIGNAVAESVFERNGFHYVSQKTDPEFDALFGTPGAKLYVQRL